MSIPDWFDATNYDCTEDWTAKEWSNAVFTRMAILDVLNSPYGADEQRLFIDSFSKAFHVEKQCEPRSIADGWNLILEFLHRNPNSIRNRDFSRYRNKYSAVSPLNLNYLAHYYDVAMAGLNHDERQFLSGLIVRSPSERVTNLGQKTVEERNLDLGREPNDWDNTLLLRVNLKLPKEMLMQQVEQLIDESRAKYKIDHLNKPLSSFDLRRWHEARILGYCDLQILSLINSVTLTNQQIGARLFPNEFDISLADRVRKVVKPLAAAAFDPVTAQALVIAATAEQKSSKIVPD